MPMTTNIHNHCRHKHTTHCTNTETPTHKHNTHQHRHTLRAQPKAPTLDLAARRGVARRAAKTRRCDQTTALKPPHKGQSHEKYTAKHGLTAVRQGP